MSQISNNISFSPQVYFNTFCSTRWVHFTIILNDSSFLMQCFPRTESLGDVSKWRSSRLNCFLIITTTGSLVCQWLPQSIQTATDCQCLDGNEILQGTICCGLKAFGFFYTYFISKHSQYLKMQLKISQWCLLVLLWHTKILWTP